MAAVNLNILEMCYFDGDSKKIGKTRVRQPTTIRFIVQMIYTTESLETREDWPLKQVLETNYCPYIRSGVKLNETVARREMLKEDVKC